MKIIIVYDSLYGNTEKIAMAIKAGFVTGHEVQTFKAKDINIRNIEEAELLIVGSPTQGGRFTEPIKIFLEKLPAKSLQDVKAATFDTSMHMEGMGSFLNSITKLFGRASQRIAQELEKCGTDVIGTETFIVLGKQGPLKDFEIERAREWAKGLIK